MSALRCSGNHQLSYCIYLGNTTGFILSKNNPKNLDPSNKMALNFGLFGMGKNLKTELIQLVYIFWVSQFV